ncbi:Uncharacterised protein [Mycobacteroides abscessus subsp. abscessus]|nr:Uncharacterised protein [Mycobacteroides abscessus subsp. abscessus]
MTATTESESAVTNSFRAVFQEEPSAQEPIPTSKANEFAS